MHRSAPPPLRAHAAVQLIEIRQQLEAQQAEQASISPDGQGLAWLPPPPLDPAAAGSKRRRHGPDAAAGGGGQQQQSSSTADLAPHLRRLLTSEPPAYQACGSYQLMAGGPMSHPLQSLAQAHALTPAQAHALTPAQSQDLAQGLAQAQAQALASAALADAMAMGPGEAAGAALLAGSLQEVLQHQLTRAGGGQTRLFKYENPVQQGEWVPWGAFLGGGGGGATTRAGPAIAPFTWLLSRPAFGG